MSAIHAPKIRQLLKENPDGLTASQIARKLGIKQRIAYVCTKSLRETWRDRYINLSGVDHAVWCIGDEPLEDAPRPERRKASHV